MVTGLSGQSGRLAINRVTPACTEDGGFVKIQLPFLVERTVLALEWKALHATLTNVQVRI